MSILLRRFLMIDSGGGQQYDADSYIQNGLVFQLDGLEKGSNTGYWTDRVTGTTFSLADTSVAESRTDGVYMKGVGVLTASDSITFPTSSEGTVEVCCDYFSGNGAVMIGPSNGSIAFGYRTTGHSIYIGRGTYVNAWTITNYSTKQVWSLNVDNAVADITGSMTVANTYGATVTMTKVKIGGRSTDDGSKLGLLYTGLIHSIRVYDRKLSVAEMQFNQRIDNVRFNLGLTP